MSNKDKKGNNNAEKKIRHYAAKITIHTHNKEGKLRKILKGKKVEGLPDKEFDDLKKRGLAVPVYDE